MSDKPHFVDPKGNKIYYSDIAERIRRDHPWRMGSHIFAQLDELGLYPAFRDGRRPFPLPRSFI